MRSDVETLVAAGFTVEETKTFDGFRECRIIRQGLGPTFLQWTQALALEYFEPVPDPDFGQRLHFADLAANKALAAATRMVERDFIDLWMLDRHILPLWRMANAASGKFPDEGPLSLVEMIARNRIPVFSRESHQHRTISTIEMPDGEPNAGLRAAIDRARDILPRLQPECLGRLQMDCKGQCVTTVEPVPIGQGSWVSPQQGGGMPSFEGIDGEMVQRLITEHGFEGSRYTGKTDPHGNLKDGNYGGD